MSLDKIDMPEQCVILIDLPVFPKGSISLALPSLASILSNLYTVKIFDLNIIDADSLLANTDEISTIAFFGLKVSSQNIEPAIKLSTRIKQNHPEIPVIWGGELPTLLPEMCLEHADTIVKGLWEPVADEFITDLQSGQLKKIYLGDNKFPLTDIQPPRFDLIKNPSLYYSFMGLPIETSRGCTEVCSFCMVHVMQKKNYFVKTKQQLQQELTAYRGKFINIVDYNFGVSAAHAIDTCAAISKSGAIGWMAEMCIEDLDNDQILAAMQASGCKIIYCGLESIEETALNSVHKMNTNHIENYERIIRKVQGYEIQIASGFILGIEGMNEKTFEKTFNFFQKMGVIYAKLTFLTFNPGTKVATYMLKKGTYTTDDISYYDGNHLSFIPNGVETDTVIKGTADFINKFYSLKSIISRSGQNRLSLIGRLEFILFNICYRDAYLQWLEKDILKNPQNFSQLLNTRFSKRWQIDIADKLLSLVRWLRSA
jgi:radical SAM superfamily enzyme YgiQ (UPF0313 family)